jgi:hypothetical protein
MIQGGIIVGRNDSGAELHGNHPRQLMLLPELKNIENIGHIFEIMPTKI